MGNWFMAMNGGDILVYKYWLHISHGNVEVYKWMYPESKLLYEEFLEFHSQTSPCMTKKLWIGMIKKSSIQSLNNWSCHIFRECKFNHQSNRLLGKLASECEVSRVIVYCFSCNGDLVWGTESSCCFLSEWGHRESCSPSNKFTYYLFFTRLKLSPCDQSTTIEKK